jgi:DNA (cytosine-5)-methyltransferase 1
VKSPADFSSSVEQASEVRATGGCGCLLTIVDEMAAARKTRAKARAIKSLELFTGAGGLALGTHLAGLDHVALLEWNGDACRTLRENAEARVLPGVEKWRVLESDVRDVTFSDFGEVDVISGGPPCQPFSIGGKHSGFDDWRNMIPQFCRAIRELTPRAFIMENVKGLLRPRFETYFSYILLSLSYPTIAPKPKEAWTAHLARLEKAHTSGKFKDLHYHVVFRLLNSADYGVPQTRQRVFVVGFRSDIGVQWNFPDATHELKSLLREQYVTGEYWERHGIKRPKVVPLPPNMRQLPLIETERTLEPWRTVRDALVGLPDPTKKRGAADVLNHQFMPGARAYPGHTGSPLDLPSKTLKAGDHGVPGGENMIAFPDGTVRYFTVREAARMQTFPDGWRFEGAWSEAMRQLGNAVPVNLARVVATSVADRLRDE